MSAPTDVAVPNKDTRPAPKSATMNELRQLLGMPPTDGWLDRDVMAEALRHLRMVDTPAPVPMDVAEAVRLVCGCGCPRCIRVVSGLAEEGLGWTRGDSPCVLSRCGAGS